jgi:hypothetical protein
VTALAQAELPGSEAALAASGTRAADVTRTLSGFRWDRLGPLLTAENEINDRGRSAHRILEELRRAVTADEFARQLAPALVAADQASFDWLREGQPPPPPPVASGRVVVRPGASPDQVVTALTGFLGEHSGEQVVVEWRVQP